MGREDGSSLRTKPTRN